MNPTEPDTNAQAGLPAVPSVASASSANLPGGANVPPASYSTGGEDLLVNAIAEAKRIEQQYRANPYQQNQALQQLKTSYLNARYHTNIKLTQN